MSSAELSPLRRRMIHELQLQRKSDKTIEVYVGYIAEVARHYGCGPDLLSTEQLRDFLHHWGT